jgi:tetratricopeptide (TPR) repeat protein
VHLTATFAHSGFAGPSLEAAKILLPQNRGRAAFEGLCANLPGAGKQFREKQVAALAPLWSTAKMPCPHDWNQAASIGLDALQKGDFALAVDCHRWCLANDPNNAQLWKNLGIAYARMGDVHGSLSAFARVDRIEAPKYAGQALREAKHGPKSVAVYRYASMWFTSPDEWLAYANAASEADDSEASAEGYSRAIALNPNAASLNVLHQLADSLNETSQYEKGAEVAQRLLQAGQNDATYTTCGLYHLGHALLGMRRYQEAGPYLERALAQNKYPENRQTYSEKLEHARRGEPLAPKPLRAATPTARLWATLESSDFKAVLSMAEATPDPKPWELCRAATTAAEFRYESENTVAVTPRARDQARAMLALTSGRSEAEAALVRLQALRIRENQLFPIDTPCVMGTRVPREQFARLVQQRRGGGGGAIQQGPADANDVVVFPGQRVGRLSDYVRMMKAMNSGGVNAALQAFGLDMASYSQVAMAWGQRISADPDLAMRFSRMMKG